MRPSLLIPLDSPMRPGRRRRAGVLLLVVLSFLTLFLLLGVTFLILASRARTTARAYLALASDRVSTSAMHAKLLEEAARQVIRGTTMPGSAIAAHDLLADRYGSGGGSVYSIDFTDPPQLLANGQLLQLSLGSGGRLPNVSGCVLTFLDGLADLLPTSCRVLTSLDDAGENSNRIVIERPPALTSLGMISSLASGPPVRVLINDRDYQGKGVSAGSAQSNPGPLLLPHGRFANLVPGYSPRGAPNEDYDSPDEQNIALARTAVAGQPGVASYHRPDLVDFWLSEYTKWVRANPGPADATPAITEPLLAALCQQPVLKSTPPVIPGNPLWFALALRAAVLRPFAFDHTPDGVYDFTGKPLSRGQPLDAIRSSSFDVDSDNDGQLDSVWIDLGFEPTYTNTGEIIKPLFAIKCVDLGGRLSLNTHGSYAHTKPSGLPRDPLSELSEDGGAEPQPRRGAGFGPTHVRIDTVLDGYVPDNDPRFPATRLITNYLLAGSSGSFSGKALGIRRDIASQPGRSGREYYAGRAGHPQWPRPGYDLFTEWTSAFRGIPANWNVVSLFAGGPVDLWSRMSIAIDKRGFPSFYNSLPDELDSMGSPAHLDTFAARSLARDVDPSVAWIDQPFAAPELASVLRPTDLDNAAALSPRLLTLDLATKGVLRGSCTTDLWDTPALIGGFPRFLPDDANSPTRAKFDHDLSLGLRMNVNRPFGNGQDDDGDGLVDETDERDGVTDRVVKDRGATVGWTMTRGPLPEVLRANGSRAQPGPDEPGLRARQLFAFHLFNLSQAVWNTFGVVNGTRPNLWLCSGTWSGRTDDDSFVFTPRDPQLVLADNQQETDSRIRNHATRELAQWCINVVDFMDPDAVMTPFRWGPTPSDVVWGCESPDLILTETLAFHDRGIADTADHGMTAGADPRTADPTWDQIRRPRGSLFVELQAVRNPHIPNPPAELYTRDKNKGFVLDLSRRPPGAGQTAPPIWRLSLTNPAEQRTVANDIFKRLATYPDTTHLDPDGGTDTGIESIRRDRYVWFTAKGPVDDPNATTNVPSSTNTFVLDEETFLDRNKSQPLTLERGRFLVIGPRRQTPLGGRSTAGAQDGGKFLDSPQSITLSKAAPAVRVTDFGGNTNPTIPQDGSVGDAVPPPGGYPETSAAWLSIPVRGQDGVYSGLNITERSADNYYPEVDDPDTLEYLPTKNNIPAQDNLFGTLTGQGTHPNVATVFLERLADPTRPHQPDRFKQDWNPYIVVDFMPIDLTVFNGESAATEQAVIGGALRPVQPDKPWHFHTRQRGLRTAANGAPLDPDFSNRKALFEKTPPMTANPWLPAWPSEVDNPPGPRQTAETGSDSNPAYFRYLLNRSTATTDTCPIHTLGWTNISFGRRLGGSEVPTDLVGAPSSPWPWLVWNDRPFESEYELLLVPRTAPGRMLTNYRNPALTPRDFPSPPEPRSPYDELGVIRTAGHLMPFTTINDPPDGEDDDDIRRSRNADLLSRLFSFLRVESRFAGTKQGLADFQTGSGDASATFRPPFHAVSRYREPGRINLNTLGHQHKNPGEDMIAQAAWDAIIGRPDEPAAPPWEDVFRMRYRSIGFDSPNPYPQRYPWRSIATWSPGRPELPIELNPPWNAQSPAPIARLEAEFSPRSFTLLREAKPGRLEADALAADDDFAFEAGVSLFGPREPADADDDTGQYAYEDRNTWFAYAPLIQAATTTTVRSETYAIWVTLGYFEVEEVDDPDDARYPDGFKILRERGTRSGGIQRHRAFLIFDRSKPTGYQPGVDHNVGDGILLQTLID